MAILDRTRQLSSNVWPSACLLLVLPSACLLVCCHRYAPLICSELLLTWRVRSCVRAVRIDLGANVTTYERMAAMLALVQRCEGPSKTQMRTKPWKLGLLLTGTPLSRALFANIEVTPA
jgi:hypothetical protein